jgi:creatinine amidohydrolase
MRVRVLVILAAIVSAAQDGPILAQQGTKGVRLSDITWQQATDVLRPETVVVIPLGAGSKEHGPHLKLGNDAILADYLTRRVVEASDVVVAPSLPYHFFPAFLEYPGSTSLTLDTARALTTEIAASLARYGPRRFYVLNTGISTSRALEPAARSLALQGILLAYTDLGAELDRASARIRQEEGGTHADEIETSMMLYIDPASVDMRRAVREFSPSTGPVVLTRRRGAPGTFSESGVWGDPTLATREKGRIVTEALVSAMLGDIENLRRTPPPAPSSPPFSSAAAAPRVPAQQLGTTGPRGCTPGDERVIRGLADAFTLHWSNADAESLSLLWTREGDIVHPDGLIERGPEVIRANRTALFMRPEYRGSKHSLSMGGIRCLSADIAVADGKWELRGLSDDKGKALPNFEGQFTAVVKHTVDGWLIEAYRYTQKPAAAPMPTVLKRPGFPGGE